MKPHEHVGNAIRTLAVLSLGLAGCAYVEPYEPVSALREDSVPPNTRRIARGLNASSHGDRPPGPFAPNASGHVAEAPQDANGVNLAARNYAWQVGEARTVRSVRTTPPPKVHFINSDRPSSASVNRPLSPKPAPPSPPVVTAPIPPPPPVAVVSPSPQAAPVLAAPPTATLRLPDRARPSRQELIRMLIEDVRDGSEPVLVRALTAVAVRAAAPDRPLDPADLAALGPAERDSVEQYHALLVRLRVELAEGGEFDAQQIAADLEQMTDQPVRVRCLHLCRKVSGFGDYELISGNSFPAGRENPMVLYLEMDRFQIQDQESGLHEVRLSQEVVLYTDPGGATVWKQPSVEIVDVSRNRRRDFFVTQLIRLPKVLGVGSYLLKITVTDEHGKTMDEIQAPVHLVAQTQ